MKNKENAASEFLQMIHQSWTWDRLTSRERDRFSNVMDHAKIKGTWLQRWEHMSDLYFAFLEGVGYEPIGWREKDADCPQF